MTGKPHFHHREGGFWPTVASAQVLGAAWGADRHDPTASTAGTGSVPVYAPRERAESSFFTTLSTQDRLQCPSCQVVSLGYQRVGCAGDLVVPAYVGGACVPTTLARRCGVSLWLRPRSGPEVSNYRTRLMQRRSTVKIGRRGGIGADGGAYTETDPVPAVLAVGSCRSAPRVRTAGAGRGHSRPKSATAMMKRSFTQCFPTRKTLVR